MSRRYAAGICLRRATPSFGRSASLCAFAVLAEIPSERPTSSFEHPAAMSATTSRCRSVSGASGAVVVLVMAGILPSLDRVIHSSAGVSPGVIARRAADCHDARVAARTDVILRDGATLRLRPPAESDVEPSRLLRRPLDVEPLPPLPGLPRGRQFVRTLVEPDWDERGALIGVVGGAGGESVVAIGNYVRLRERATAEAAFAVADDWQRRGSGRGCSSSWPTARRSTGSSVRRRGAAGERRDALRLRERRLHADANARRRRRRGPVPIEPTVGYRERVDERDHVGVIASLRPFFEPRTVAVVGASPRRGTIGGELFRNVLAGGFTGAAYPVNRGGEPVGAVRGYRSLDEIDDESTSS